MARSTRDRYEGTGVVVVVPPVVVPPVVVPPVVVPPVGVVGLISEPLRRFTHIAYE